MKREKKETIAIKWKEVAIAVWKKKEKKKKKKKEKKKRTPQGRRMWAEF